MFDQVFKDAQSAVSTAIDGFVNFDTIFVFIIALVLAYFVSKLVTSAILKIAKLVSKFGELDSKPERIIHSRRLETYLSVSLALIRAGIYAIAIFAAWQYTHPETSSVAFISASTLFIVMAGATLAPVLRDITAGSVMIAERWYNVGDFVSLEPFSEISGVVERVTLRSTKLRSIKGEVIWVHNQNIQGVRVATKGVRTLAIDLFVNNLKQGKALFEHTAKTLPVGPTMLAQSLTIVDTDKLGDDLWHITAVCQTAPGREWLIEDFGVETIKEQDKAGTKKVIVHGPLVRYADTEAERRFKRSVRIKRPPIGSAAQD